jgi:hypothetical protein
MLMGVNGIQSAQFQRLLGAFKGDCLSSSLSTLAQAGTLCELRTDLAVAIGRPDPPISSKGLPLDIEYADDVDFMDEEEENLNIILPMVTDILKRWNLFVDEVKADFTHVYLASTGEQGMSRKL